MVEPWAPRELYDCDSEMEVRMMVAQIVKLRNQPIAEFVEAVARLTRKNGPPPEQNITEDRRNLVRLHPCLVRQSKYSCMELPTICAPSEFALG